MPKQKSLPAPATHFVVARTTWRVAGDENILARLPGETRVAAFPDFESAEADRAAREATARKVVNPFKCGVLWTDRTHLPEPVFRDFIKDAGIEPPAFATPDVHDKQGKPVPRRAWCYYEVKQPEGTFLDWAAWWDAVSPTLSAEQVARVWEGLDRVRFFRADERPVRDLAYTVVEIKWNYNDMWYYPGDEGGEHVVAYRSRARAEEECARRNAEARERWRANLHLGPPEDVSNPGVDPDRLYQFDMQSRPFPGRSPFEPQPRPPKRVQEDANEGLFTVDEVPFFEVVEIEVEGA